MQDVSDGPAAVPLPIGDRAAGDAPVLVLVDDDAPLRRSLQRALERRGFQVYAAESLKAGHQPRPQRQARIRRDRPAARGRQRHRAGPPPARAAPQGAGGDPHRLRQHRHRGGGGEGRCGRLSGQARRRRRRHQRAARHRLDPAAAAAQPDVGRPGALGAHPARVRAVQPQRLGDRAAPEHAPPHAAADPQQARAAGNRPARHGDAAGSRRKSR